MILSFFEWEYHFEHQLKDTDIFLLSAHYELKITSRGIIIEPILGFVTSSINDRDSGVPCHLCSASAHRVSF